MDENEKEKTGNGNAGVLATMRRTPTVGSPSCSGRARSSMGTSRVSLILKTWSARPAAASSG